MKEPNDLLPELVDSLSESTPVDWERAFSRAGEGEQAGIVRALKDIEDIAGAHRDIRLREEALETAAFERWGPLLIEGKLGQGGYAEVFLARDPQLHRQVALKLFHPERVRQLGRDVLLNEGRALARLRHENVVAVYGADERDGRVGIWMEYVEGATLRAVIEEHGRMSSDEAVSIGRRLCDALAAVHAKGMLHGDVKSQNVMRQGGEDGGRIVLMDFSSIRSTDRSLPGRGDEKLAGTPLYMAPELWEGAEPDVTTDIYSLGVLLYFLVTGSFPVRARTIEDLRAAHRRGERVLLRDARAELPDEFVRVVERALAVRSEERFQSAGEMRQALDDALTPSQLEVSGSIPAQGGRRSHPLVYLAGVLLGLTGLGFVSSKSYELFLQIPREFVSEGPFDYLTWGVRFMIPIAVIWFALGGGLLVVGFLVRRVFTRLRRTSKREATSSRGRARAWLERNDPLTAALWIVAIAGAAFAIITWSFGDILSALIDLRYAPTNATIDVTLLGPAGRDFQKGRDVAYALLSLAVLIVLFLLFPSLEERSGGDRTLHLTRWALASIVAASLALCAVPYKAIWHNRSERVTFRGLRAYEIAKNETELVLYIPGGSQRHLIVRRDDPRLVRSADRVYENIFQPP